ncbi:MAG: hypothetical protein ABI661_09455 [Gammaproteobacteria bacterium]
MANPPRCCREICVQFPAHGRGDAQSIAAGQQAIQVKRQEAGPTSADGYGLEKAVTVGEATVGDINQATGLSVNPPVLHPGLASKRQ